MRSLRSQQGACVRATLLASKGRALHRSGLLAVWWTKVLANMAEYPQTGISIQPRRCRATTLPRFRRRLPRPTRTPRPRTRSRPNLLLLLIIAATVKVSDDYGYGYGRPRRRRRLAGPTRRKDVMRGFFFSFARSLPPSYHRQRSNHRNSYILTLTVLCLNQDECTAQHQRSGLFCASPRLVRLFRLTVSLSLCGRSISLSLPRYTVRSLLLTKGFARF